MWDVWRLYYIFILHQTTTGRSETHRTNRLYYIFILHQTTTILYPFYLLVELYYIFILHQTTTKGLEVITMASLYYTFILHQTTTQLIRWIVFTSCIIPSFYIKPQLVHTVLVSDLVVLYLHSTSNHNRCRRPDCCAYVVLYLHSTSNHNRKLLFAMVTTVVLYLHSTSNHNHKGDYIWSQMLYYTFILHQTTTCINAKASKQCCIIPSFYIKPQLPSVL